MTRTPAHADKGAVNILFGGDADLMEYLRPGFETYAENTLHVGPSDHAIRLKLIHNDIAFANVATFCEGFALTAREGLDTSKVIGIISAAGGKSGMMDLYGDATLLRDFTPHVSLSNAQKDVRDYAEWLEQAGLPGFMAQYVHQSLRKVDAHRDQIAGNELITLWTPNPYPFEGHGRKVQRRHPGDPIVYRLIKTGNLTSSLHCETSDNIDLHVATVTQNKQSGKTDSHAKCIERLLGAQIDQCDMMYGCPLMQRRSNSQHPLGI